jgi:hypothetical protein
MNLSRGPAVAQGVCLVRWRGEFESSAVEFVETFLGGGFGGPVEVEVGGGPPNLGWDIKDDAAAATRPGPL